MRHLLLLVPVTLISVAVAAPVPKPRAKPVQLLDDAGEVLASAAEITGYEWDTHTLLLDEKAERRLMGTTSRSFAVAVGWEVMYRVNIKSPVGCSSVGEVFIHQNFPNAAPTGRVKIGYHAGRRPDKADPRADDRVQYALARAGKLAEKK